MTDYICPSIWYMSLNASTQSSMAMHFCLRAVRDDEWLEFGDGKYFLTIRAPS
jgi:hypothetical protein